MNYNQYGNYGYPSYSFQPQQPQSNGMTWVQGEAGANAYQVGTGQVAVLFDSTRDVFYVKSVDQYGKPNALEAYDFKKHVEVAENATTPDMSQYVTKAELEEILKAKKPVEKAK